MTNDLARMAQSPTHTVSVMNQAGLAAATADFEDRAKHGGKVSTAEISAEWAARLKKAADDKACQPYAHGSPPVSAESKGLPAERARLADYVAWLWATTVELESLLEIEHRVNRIIDEPAESGRKLTDTLKSEASRLIEAMGFIKEGSTAAVEASAHERVLKAHEANQRNAQVAAAALPELQERIRVKRLQLAALENRRNEFLHPVLVEIGDHLGHALVKRISALRDVVQQVSGLAAVVGGGYGDGWTNRHREPIKLARPNFQSTKLCPDSVFEIKPDPESEKWWRQTGEALMKNPKVPVTFPKSA
jgi:hypothetical protein